ncbi:MAG TPA: hypothetical protein PLB01_17745 [Thermoanaerobaculia bacterium]|nr:hypothetical protein [Thermoanaerobaculia bacterium]
MRGRPRIAARVCALGVALLLPRPLYGLPVSWDVQAKGVFTYRVGSEGGVGKRGQETTTFLEGEDVQIECLYLVKQGGDKKDFTTWQLGLSVDGSGMHSWPMNANVGTVGGVGSKSYVWKADKSGSRKIRCAAETYDADPSNNAAEITVTVKARPPLTEMEIPTPVPQSPPPGKKIALVPNLYLTLSAQVPQRPVGGWPNLFDYVIHRPYQSVKWHVDIVGPSRGGAISLSTRPAGDFQGFVSNLSYKDFNAFVTRDWLDARGLGPGHYAALFYLSETANGKTTNGKKGVVEFELVAPLMAGAQPAGGGAAAGPSDAMPTSSGKAPTPTPARRK